MKKILLTGSQGFIGSYICNELLNNGYKVIGVDNFQKYGKITRAHDNHPNFKLYDIDVLSDNFLEVVDSEKPNMIIAGAAMIGGISYFHKFAYDLLATNERILAQTFDAAISAHKKGYLERIIVLSSSMVFEETSIYPTPESAIKNTPPPASTYGFQKLASEYFAKFIADHLKAAGLEIRNAEVKTEEVKLPALLMQRHTSFFLHSARANDSHTICA